MTELDFPIIDSAEAYEPPSIARAGSLSELTRNAQRPNGDGPARPSAFGPDS